MWYTLTFDGLPVGRVDLTNAPRAIGPLLAVPAFETTGLRTAARRLGLALRVIGAHRVIGTVAARALAGALRQSTTLRDRLGLVDFWGRHAGVVSITVVEFPRADALVVARLREQAAGRRASLDVTPADPGHRSRPAA